MLSENSNNILMKKLQNINIIKEETWAIYGTSEGAEMLLGALEKLQLTSAIKYIIDRDDVVGIGKFFHNIPLVKLQDVVDGLNGILIGAMCNHIIINQRIQDSLTEEQSKKIKVIDFFVYSTMSDKVDYINFLEKNIIQNKEEFVEFDNDGFCRKEEDAKIIAWYLPQFHQMEINHKFHGQGFTEWTNTTRMLPLFKGHYQPHIPYDVGYYDLLNEDTLKRQIYLAKHYGIYGFCFHYYWFSGKRIMEKPLELFLEHKEFDMPFCLNWATENWTALWDGGNREVMLEQKLKDDDDEKFMQDILPYMKDSSTSTIK